MKVGVMVIVSHFENLVSDFDQLSSFSSNFQMNLIVGSHEHFKLMKTNMFARARHKDRLVDLGAAGGFRALRPKVYQLEAKGFGLILNTAAIRSSRLSAWHGRTAEC
jgi:hypothetical protein